MSNYWAERQAKAQAKLTSKNIRETEAQLKKYYQRTMKKVIEDFEATYNKLLLTVEDGREPTPADLYKLDKYWQMQAQLKTELQRLGDKQAAALSKAFEAQFFDVYNSFSLPSKAPFSTIDKAGAKQLMQDIWCADGRNWSSRVWGNTEKLQQALNDNLIECVVSGKKPTQLKALLQEQFNASYNRADTLVKTEMAHIQTQAAQQRYKDYGIEQVEVFVDEDERTCPICAKHEGEKYFVADKMPVPFHPRCRCCMIPVINDNEVEEEEIMNTCKRCGKEIEEGKTYCKDCAAIKDNQWMQGVKKAGFQYNPKKDTIESTELSDKIFDYNYGYDGEHDNLMYACIDCGQLFFTSGKKSVAQKRCPDCQKKYRKQYKAEKEKERRKKKKQK